MKKNKSKDERIAAENTRLRKIYSNIPADQVKSVDGLIHRAAFLRIQLEDFEADMKEHGAVEMFTQSPNTPPYERERPVARLYSQGVKNYQAITRQLADMVPKVEQEEDDGFDDFVASRDD